MPSQRFSHRAVAPAPATEVWTALQQPQTWEAIPGIDRVVDPVLEKGSLQGFSFETTAGGRRYVGQATPAAREEGRLLIWRIESAEVRGSIRVELQPADGETGVEVSVDVESVGLLSSLFFPVIASAVRNGLPDAVERFAAELA